MHTSQNNINHCGTLSLVATPIGNLEDISLRALNVLKMVDLILCEDTRKTRILLQRHLINTPVLSLHEHNEEKRTPSLIKKLQSGENMALVSDAGTPLQSDPGFYLTRAVIDNEMPLEAIPGANAAVTALILSGLPPYPYLFIGFLPQKKVAKSKYLQKLTSADPQSLTPTLIFYESPRRLEETLKEMANCLGEERQAFVGRELTKKFEEHRYGTLSELAAYYREHPPRGEIVIVVGPPTPRKPTLASLDTLLPEALEKYSLKEASKQLAQQTGLSSRDIYQYGLRLRSGDNAKKSDD